MQADLDDSRWLARYGTTAVLIVGGLEWLLGRTISRMAAVPVLDGTPRDVVELAGRAGLFLVSPALLLLMGLLVLAVLLLGRRAVREGHRWDTALAIYLAILVALVGAHTMLPLETWLNTSFNLLMAAGIWWLTVRFLLHPRVSAAMRAGVALVGAAYTGWYVFVLAQSGGDISPGSGLPLWAISLGELAVVLAPFAFFAAIAVPGAQWRHPRRWILPVLLALLFSAGSIADWVFNQGFTGVFTTWSLGINLTWPWPLYSVALALYAYSLLTCFARKAREQGEYANPNTGAGLLFLLLAAYNLQIPYQHLLAVLALLLLTGLFTPYAAADDQAVRSGVAGINPAQRDSGWHSTPAHR